MNSDIWEDELPSVWHDLGSERTRSALLMTRRNGVADETLVTANTPSNRQALAHA